MISEVYNMDCMEYMKTVPDKFFDIAIVDPPYGIKAPNMVMGGGFSGGKYNSSKFKENKKRKIKENESEYTWDNIPPDENYFKELFRVSKNQIIWGGNYFYLPPTRCVIAWDKCQPWENFSQIEIAWTSFDKPAKLYRQINSGANSEKKIHPTQKPVELYMYLLSRFAEKGNKIFDSHLGSGSSRIAAYEYGFDFYACELNKTYFDKAECCGFYCDTGHYVYLPGLCKPAVRRCHLH